MRTNFVSFGSLLISIAFFIQPAVSQEQTNPATTDGAAVYQKLGCRACHGEHLGGTGRGPTLTKLATNWDEKSLIVYLKQPGARREKDERLRKLSDRYAPVKMLQYTISDPDLKALVKFLLQPKKRPKP